MQLYGDCLKKIGSGFELLPGLVEGKFYEDEMCSPGGGSRSEEVGSR